MNPLLTGEHIHCGAHSWQVCRKLRGSTHHVWGYYWRYGCGSASVIGLLECLVQQILPWTSHIQCSNPLHWQCVLCNSIWLQLNQYSSPWTVALWVCMDGLPDLIHTYLCSSGFPVCDNVAILQCWIWYVFYEGFAFANNYRFGSARAVNRRYISDCVPAKFTLQASAAFVSASALGMATGPALAGLLEVHTSQFGITLNANTLPGWIMAGGWFLFLLWLWLGFKEPSHHDPITPSSHSSDINRGGNEWFKPLASVKTSIA